MISDWYISLLFVTGQQDMTNTLLLQELFIYFILFCFGNLQFVHLSKHTLS